MKTRILILILCFFTPLTSHAQIELFLKEYAQVQAKFAQEQIPKITQQYSFSRDSARAIPFDSGICIITRYDNKVHVEFSGVESFTDGEYLVRVSNPSKFMVISRSTMNDSAGFSAFIEAGLATFKDANKTTQNDKVIWRLTGGINGVLSTEITLSDTRVLNIIAELSADHPFLAPLFASPTAIRQNVFVTISYSYSDGLPEKQVQLSEYILIDNGTIQPSEKYKEYKLKIIE